MDNPIRQLLSEAGKHGVALREVSPGHWQIRGHFLVNWYPCSKRMTAYVAATRESKAFVSAKQAVQMALSAPPITSGRVKRKQYNRNGPVFQGLWRKQSGNCWLCSKPMRLDCDVTAWDYATIEHKISLGRGGLDNPNNLALTHLDCNNRRGNAATFDHPPPTEINE